MSKYMSHKPRLQSIPNFANRDIEIAQRPMHSTPFIKQSYISVQNRSFSKIHAMTSLFKKRKITQDKRKTLENHHSQDIYRKNIPQKLKAGCNNAAKLCTKIKQQFSNQAQEIKANFDKVSNVSLTNASFVCFIDKPDHYNKLKAFMPSLLVRQEDWMMARRSPNVYIKTAQGKKTKIDTLLYFKKIGEKLNKIGQLKSSVISVMTQQQHAFNHTKSFRKPRSKTVFEPIASKRQETTNKYKIDQCRPWSSCSSQIFQ